MIHPRTGTSWRSLETLFRLGNLGNVDDGQLLERFRTCNDARGAEAFRVLVERYGPIVLGVCRGVLGDLNHADDAFQATFLVLVRKAGAIRNRESIGPWLHGVALRVARRARAQAARRSEFERPLAREACATLAIAKDQPDDTIEVVHEEIDRLPDNLRNPLVLCCLEELTYEQAARQLGVNEPTLRGRLHRGRQQLKARLQARGVSGGAILPMDAPATSLLVPVSHALVEATVQLASKWFTLGCLVIGAGSPAVHLLVQGVIRTMIWNSVKTTAIPALIAASVLGTAVLAQQGRDSGRAPGGAGSQAAPFKPSSGSDLSPQKKQPGDGKPQAVDEQTITELKALKQLQRQKKTAHIRELLARESDLAFPNGVSLEQLLKAVKSSTSSKDDPGIPIYVDPTGLHEVDKTLESRVVVMPGHTLADVLQRALREIKLGYVVDDGFLMIDSRLGTIESRLARVEEKLDRLINQLEKKGSRP
jgi:RNA polymerase sigma factor (sigma-70 family)